MVKAKSRERGAHGKYGAERTSSASRLTWDCIMKAYHITAPAEWAYAGLSQIDATHPVTLPAVNCPLCGVWASAGLEYPSVDVNSIQQIIGAIGSAPLTVEEFRTLRASISALLPNYPIGPGTEFGSLAGTAATNVAPVAWASLWTILIDQDLLRATIAAGVILVAAQAGIELNGGRRLFEIEAVPQVSLIGDLVPERCKICGRLPIQAPLKIILQAETFDPNQPIQRIYELPTYIIVNEHVASVITDYRINNVMLTEAELV